MPDRGRRQFVGVLGTAASAGILSHWFGGRSSAGATPASTSVMTSRGRARAAFDVRVAAARRLLAAPVPVHRTNGDEDRHPNHLASYSKGLPHNPLGEVQPAAFAALLRAVRTRDPDDFERIPMGGDRRLVNPQAGLAFDMLGPDAHSLSIPPPPAFSSAQEAAELAENYWMSLLRDVPFSEYPSHPLVARAAADVSRFSAFDAPKAKGVVTPETLFRSSIAGSQTGPYVSQFLYLEARFGAERMPRQMRTVRADADYLTTHADWLTVQNGTTPWSDQYDPTPRYIRNVRDLGQWVHYDLLFQAYLEALLVLFRIGARRHRHDPYWISQNQVGSSTFGSNHISSLLSEVARPAAKAAWFQKWFVHRSLRPEAFGGRVHNHMTGRATYPIHPEILNSDAVQAVFSKQGTYLLAQAYPEGSPLHPSYPAGHATVAGACTTILKAFFDGTFVIRNPRQPSADGCTLEPYEGPPLTVGGELDKLACNVAFARNMAGVHWRSDAEASLRLGEEVAAKFLRDDRDCLPERFDGYAVTKFDGTPVTI
jgi:hypothetical protein